MWTEMINIDDYYQYTVTIDSIWSSFISVTFNFGKCIELGLLLLRYGIVYVVKNG